MKFSIVIPLYNKQNYIMASINSVLMQSYKGFEVVVVDDGSTDNSVEVVSKISDKRVRLIQKENGGPSSARNAGVDNATNDWILFLDADDYLLPNALQHFNNIILRNKNIKCFTCNFYISSNKRLRKYSHICPNGIVANPYLSWSINTLMPRTGASVFHKDVLSKHPMNSNLRRNEDAQNLFEIMREYSFYRSNTPVMVYNCDACEASHRLKNIDNDFLGHLNFNNKSIWEQIALYRMLRNARTLYAKDSARLYSNIKISSNTICMAKFIQSAAKVIRLYNSVANKLIKAPQIKDW